MRLICFWKHNLTQKGGRSLPLFLSRTQVNGMYAEGKFDRRLSIRNPGASLIYRRVEIVNITAGASCNRSIGHVQRCFHFLVNAHHNRRNEPYPRLLSGWYLMAFSVFAGIA